MHLSLNSNSQVILDNCPNSGMLCINEITIEFLSIYIFFFNSVDPVSSHTSTTAPMDTDEPHGEKWDGSGGVLVQSSGLYSV